MEKVRLLPPKLEQLKGTIHLSSSKSESNRALIIQALAKKDISILNLSNARDTKTLQTLLSNDPEEWDVLDAGTVMRFGTAYLATRDFQRTITGTNRMKQRPISVLVKALKEIGAEIDYLENSGFPPLKISGIKEQLKNTVHLPGNISSQYISAILMIAPLLDNGIKIVFTSEVYSKPYILMTLKLMNRFGIEYHWSENEIEIKPQSYSEGEYKIESDWSGASYWYSVAAMGLDTEIKLTGLKENSLQGDQEIVDIMKNLGVSTTYLNDGVLLQSKRDNVKNLDLDFRKCPDIAQTVMVAAAVRGCQLRMTGLESLKIKETDRVKAMENELQKIGAHLIEKDREWHLLPGTIPESIKSIDTYEDHRMAMSFAPLGVRHQLEIVEPSVVNKSYPAFWKDLNLVGIETQMK